MYMFDENVVVWLWMMEGLVHPVKKQENCGRSDEYFDKRVSRSPIQWSVGEEARMHDPINDLATIVSVTYCVRPLLVSYCKVSLNILRIWENWLICIALRQ
ncbi:NBS resistance protein [Spatholobus suberectus]|nr:NBS resistance protein [Spatholobus suberectus]